MQRLSAADAINPAWSHTWSLLIAPRQWRTLLKVGAVAVFAQMGGCNGSSGNRLMDHPGAPHIGRAGLLAIVAAVGLLALILSLAFFYLGSRLQFVLLDIVLLRDTRVAPAWQRHAKQTWRWIGLKLLFFLLAVICLVPVFIPFFLRVLHMSRTDHPVDPAATVLMIFAFILLLLLFILVITVLYTLLIDFALPFIAVEDRSGTDAVKAVLSLVRTEPGQFAFYVFIRLVLGFVGGIVAYLGIALAGLILALPLGAAGYGLWSGLHAAGPGARLAMIAGMVLLAILLLVPIVALFLMAFGFILCFVQAYALFFLGGRYAPVGEILDPTPLPPPAWIPPPPTLTSYT